MRRDPRQPGHLAGSGSRIGPITGLPGPARALLSWPGPCHRRAGRPGAGRRRVPHRAALTLIAAEVCESFSPPLSPDEHRRNLITRSIDLNRLVGRDFVIGEVHWRGIRLCEPCMIQRRALRPLLRQLVFHVAWLARAGLNAWMMP